MAADGLLDGPDLGRRQLEHLVVGLHDVVQLRDVDERVAVGARHVRVDLGDDRLGHGAGGLGVVD